jgi:hypothetical protein
MADRAFNEIALNTDFSYRSFIKYVDEVINEEFSSRNKLRVNTPYTEKEFKNGMYWVTLKNKFKKHGFVVYQRLPSRLRSLVKMILRPKQAIDWLKSK